jgi:adenylate kinase
MLNIIICGAPGCGKGTQSELIAKTYNLTHLSTGDLLRTEIEAETELGVIINNFISKGNLVPDDMIIRILIKAVENKSKESKGVILDGFPRTVAQAEVLEKVFNNRDSEINVLLDLQVDEDELIARLVNRGKTSGRSDDNLETIKKRLEVYERKTAPVSDFYKKRNKYAAIKGTGTVEKIFARIASVIDTQE